MTTELTTADTTSHELTTETMIDLLDQVVRETSRKTWRGELLKFVKGHFQIGKDEDEIEVGTKMVAIVPSLIKGWIKWQNGKPAVHEMGVVVEAYHAPTRDALGDNEPAHWERDKDGKPRDPWQENMLMIMFDEEKNIFTFSTGSKGGMYAITDLLRAYGPHARMHPTQVPVIELGTSSYKHDTYGKVHKPMFTVIGWEEQAPFLALLSGGGDEPTKPPTKPKSMAGVTKKKKDGGKKHNMRGFA